MDQPPRRTGEMQVGFSQLEVIDVFFLDILTLNLFTENLIKVTDGIDHCMCFFFIA